MHRPRFSKQFLILCSIFQYGRNVGRSVNSFRRANEIGNVCIVVALVIAPRVQKTMKEAVMKMISTQSSNSSKPLLPRLFEVAPLGDAMTWTSKSATVQCGHVENNPALQSCGNTLLLNHHKCLARIFVFLALPVVG